MSIFISVVVLVVVVLQALMVKLGHFGTEAILADEAEVQRHQQLQNLYNSTRAAKVESP